MTTVLLLNHRLAPSVSLEPKVIIRRWRIVKTAMNEELLAGILPNGYTWRVTTPIMAFYSAARCITTQLGHKYKLGGPPAVDGLDLLVIEAQLALNQVGHSSDTSEIYWQAMAQATH